jgi:hypothetical protein
MEQSVAQSPTKTADTPAANEPVFIITRNDKSGVVGHNGKIVVKPQFEVLFDFSDGLALISVDGRYGYIDQTGKMVIKPQFSLASDFSGGLAYVTLNSEKCYIDKTGKCVIKATPPMEYQILNRFSEGLASVSCMNLQDYFAGACYIDKTGKIVFKVPVDVGGLFSEGLATVVKDRKYGYVDSTGRTVVEVKFDNARDFMTALQRQRSESCGATSINPATGLSNHNLKATRGSIFNLEISQRVSQTCQ